MAKGYLVALALAMSAFASSAVSLRAGTISLELRPGVTRAQVGTTVAIGLYAVSDTGTPQPFSGLEALPVWDPSRLELMGLTNNGGYAWLTSWFPTDGLLDGMNDTWTDGNAFYQAFGRFPPAPHPQANAAGLLVTTWRFQAVQAGTATISFLPNFGDYSYSRVLDAEKPGEFLTGSMRAATIVVFACGADADADDDCDVDLVDFDAYDACLMGPDLAIESPCLFRDLDGDDAVDLRDFAETQRAFTGSVSN